MKHRHELEVGKVYYVWNLHDNFFMIGRALGKYDYDDPYNLRCSAKAYTSHGSTSKSWCYYSEDYTGKPFRVFREAKPSEVRWFEKCEKAGKFVQNPGSYLSWFLKFKEK